MSCLKSLFLKFVGTYTSDQCTSVIKLRNHEIRRKPWVTNGLLNSIKTKNELYKRYKSNMTDDGLRETYRRYRNTLNSMINITNNNYSREKLMDVNNTKALWSTVKEISGEKNTYEVPDASTRSIGHQTVLD